MNVPIHTATAQSLLLSSRSRSLRRFDLARRVLLVLPWFGFILQCLLASSFVDVICAALAASGSFLVLFDAFRLERFYLTPLSTLVVLGFAITLQLGPLLFTAFEGHSITFNLLVPIGTFGHGVLSSLVCLLAHVFYRKSSLLLQGRASMHRLLLQLNLFKPLRPIEVIVMGSLGIFALAIASWFSGLAGENTTLFKLVQGFEFLSVIPVAFVLQPLGSKKARSENATTRASWALFVLFITLVTLVSLGANSRGSLVVPFACLLLGLVLEWLFGLIRIRWTSVFAGCLAIVLLLPLATDMATAMVMVRGQRGNVPPAALLKLTLNQFQDRDAIQRYRLLSFKLGLTRDWSEAYVSNLFLARFANAKFPDNSLDNASKLISSPSARAEIANFQWARLLLTLPSPALSALGVPDGLKHDLLRYSMGDKLYSLSSRSQYALGGFRTGHFFGTGIAGFGLGYTVLLLIGLLLVFPLVDSHALTIASPFLSPPLISVVAITELVSWLTLSNAESVVSILSFCIRGFIEPVLLFSAVRWLVARF